MTQLFGIVLAAAFVSWAAPAAEASAACTPDLAPDPPDVVFDPEIRSRAAALGYDATRIYEFVRNEVSYTPYYGLRKGPVGTLRSASGNEYDIAALLVSLLRVSEDANGDCVLGTGEDGNGNGVLDGGTRARFVRGRINVPYADARAWTGGLDDAIAPANTEAGALKIWRETEHWAPSSAEETTDMGSAIQRLHIWVEAEVPSAQYRGVGGLPTGRAWLALDASFKKRAWKPTPLVSFGPGGLQFDYGAYYSAVQSRSPMEVLDEQIRDHLNMQGGASPASPLDADLRGPIIALAPGILPNRLPYDVLATPVSRRGDGLVELHSMPSGGWPAGWSAGSGQAGGDDYRWFWILRVCAQSVQSPACVAGAPIDYRLTTAEAEVSRVILLYPPPVGQGLTGENANGYTTCDDPPQVVPSLRMNGAEKDSGAALALCEVQTVSISLETPVPYASAIFEEPAGSYPAVAGGVYAFALDAGSAGSETTRAAVTRLLAASEALQVNVPEDPEDPATICRGATCGPIGADFEAQDELVGGFLQLVAARHLALARRGYDHIYAVHHEIALQLPWAGLVESIPVVGFIQNAPFLVRPNTLYIDLKGYRFASVNRTTGARGSLFSHAGELIAAHTSTLEHLVWEELANAEAISTVKSFQVRAEQSSESGPVDLPVPVTSLAEAHARTSTCNDSQVNVPLQSIAQGQVSWNDALAPYVCTGIDAATYCRIKEMWAPTAEIDPDPLVCNTQHSQYPAPPSCQPIVLPQGYQWRAMLWDLVECPCRKSEEDFEESGGCPNIPGFEPRETLVSNRAGIVDYLGWTGSAWAEKYTRIEGVAGPTEHISFSIARDFKPEPAGGASVLFNDFDACIADLLACDSFSIDIDREIFQLNLPLNNLHPLGDPVSTVTGNLQHTEVDFTIPSRGGTALQFKRSYNSRLDYAGPLGNGWVHTYDQHLRFEDGDVGTADDRVVFLDDDGNETPFEDPTGAAGFLVAPSWYHSTLERKSDGKLELTTKQGVVFTFDARSGDRANLLSIRDRNANVVSLNYSNGKLSTVTDPAGRSLTFTHDGFGLITITDWSSPARIWRYRVNAAGDFIQYTDPEQVALGAAGKSTEYTYYLSSDGPNAAHNLRCMIMPEDRGDGGGFEQLCGSAAAGRSWTHFVYYANDAVYEHTTSLGETTRFFYDYFRRRTTVTYPDGAEEAYIFDRVGNIVRAESPRGVIHQYEYADGTRNRETELDGFNQATTAEYDAKGNVTRRIDRLDHEERWTYDASSQPVSHIDRLGNRREWHYDSRGNLLEELAEIDGSLEVLVRHEYDGFGNRVKTTSFAEPRERGARTNSYVYSSNGVSLLLATDPLGHATRITNDALGRPIRVDTERKTGDGQVETLAVTLEYDRNDRVISTTDPGGTITEIEFDLDGNQTIERSVLPQPGQPGPTGVAFKRQYDFGGRVIRLINEAVNTQVLEYDARGRVVRASSTGGNFTSFEYDADGNRTKAIDPTGATTTFEYDGDNRLVTTRDALGRESRVEYDAEGRVIERWAPNDRLVATITYDAEGNATDVVDALGRLTKTTFDELGRTRSVTALHGTGNAATTTFAYDLTGALVERKDPKNHITRYSYDARGRLIETIDPLGRRSGNTYDEIGDLVEVVNGAGERLRLDYDVRGNVTRRSGPGIDDTFTYDGRSRLIVARNAERTLRYEHDSLGRVIAMSDPDHVGTVRNGYDGDNRVVQLVYPTHASDGYPAPGVVTNFQYDGAGRLTAVLDPAGDWQFQYDALGRPTLERGPNGETRRTFYTEEGWVDRIELRFANGTTETVTYSNYDAAGRPQTIASGEAGTPTAIIYHPRGWITGIGYPDGTTEGWSYDKAGNRTVHVPRSSGLVYAEHDAADQLTRIHDGADVTLESFTYDGAGRRASRTASGATTEYAYDVLGRLTAVASPSYALGLFYDALGAKTRRTETGQPEARFLGPWAERRSNAKYRQVAAPGGMGPLGETQASTDWTYLRDGAGNAIRTSQNGNPLHTRRYEAFGKLRSGAIGSLPRGFAGLPTEGSSGLYHASARHYDPATGRFLQPDPAGLYAPNLYAYAANNPVVYGDPTGLAPWLSLSGPPDWLGFDAGDPFFGRSSALQGLTNRLQDLFVQSMSPFLPVYDFFGAGGIVQSMAAFEESITNAITTTDDLLGGGLLTLFDFGSAVSSLFSVGGNFNEPTIPLMGPAGYLGLGATVAAGRGAAAPERLFHYTTTDAAEAIAKEGLIPGRNGHVFLSPEGGLTPLQAHIDLALPPNRAANALFEIDAAAMRRLGIDVPAPTPVGRMYNMPGGGFEVPINRAIPPDLLRRIR